MIKTSWIIKPNRCYQIFFEPSPALNYEKRITFCLRKQFGLFQIGIGCRKNMFSICSGYMLDQLFNWINFFKFFLLSFRNAFQIYPAILELERVFVWVVQTMKVKRADFLRLFNHTPDIRGGNSHLTKQQSLAIRGSSFFYFKTNSGYLKICWTPYGHHYAGSSFAAALKDSFLRQFP